MRHPPARARLGVGWEVTAVPSITSLPATAAPSITSLPATAVPSITSLPATAVPSITAITSLTSLACLSVALADTVFAAFRVATTRTRLG
jgi:hypothetical protein